jgi:hypothetical protein
MVILDNGIDRDSQTEELRYELKAQLSVDRLSQIHSWIIAHSRAFRIAYPARWVNNIYFDTWDLDSFNDHLEGIETHQKLRLRWYGQEISYIGKAYLELKRRNNRLGKKWVQEIPCDFNLQEKSWTEIMNFFHSRVNDQFMLLFNSIHPVSISRFFREYFVTADGETRLTLDYGLKSFDQRFSVFPNLRYVAPQLNNVIMELKSGMETAPALADLIAEFPFRFDKYSKYVSTLQGILE